MTARPALALAGLLVALGLVVSRPLALEWRTALPVNLPGVSVDRPVLTRAPGDTLQLYYQLWLARDGLVGPTPAFTDPYQFRLDGPRPNLPQTFPPLSLPFTALSVLGPTVAYNLLVLLSFPLTGLAAFLLVRRYTGHAGAAATAALALALAPARLGPLFGGHPAGFAFALVPVVLWGLDVAVQERRLAGGLAGGGALLALAMLEPHHTYLVGAFLLVYGPVRWLTAADRRLAAGPLAAFALLAAAGAAWLWGLRQAFLLGSIADTGRTLAEVRLFSPGPAALLEAATWGGLAVPVLAGLGLVLTVPGRERAPGTGLLRLVFGVVLGAGIVLSLGPTLPGIPLYQGLHRWVPLFALIRNPGKFQLLTGLGGAVLAGLGAAALLARVPPAGARWATAGLLAVVVAGTAPRHAVVLTSLPHTPVHDALRAARRVVYVPLWPGDSAWSSVYLHDVTRTRAPMLNGYSPLVPRRYLAEVYGPLQGLNVGDLGPVEHAALLRLGVSHLVLDRATFPAQVSPFPTGFTLARLRDSPALVLERSADPLWLFRLTGQPPPGPGARTSPVGVFYEAEALPRQAGAIEPDPAASAGRATIVRAGAGPGFLTFGPYRLLPAGAYRAVFRTRGAGLDLDVATDLGQTVLARAAAAAGSQWTLTTLGFRLAEARPVELRARWTGGGQAAVDWVLVVFADRPEPEWSFEVEDLPHRLGERPDAAASAGWVGYADPVVSVHADLVSGPTRLFPAGRYQLRVRVRADAPGPGPLLRLRVTEPAGRTLAERTVAGVTLPPGSYHEVPLDFELGEPTVLEFPVGYLGGTGVSFDRLTVSPR